MPLSIEIPKFTSKDALEEYAKGNVHIKPTYPGILVRLIPKPAFFGSILLSEGARNKPVYEGIVVDIYDPITVPLRNPSTNEEQTVELKSLHKPGDHILFAHWAGNQHKLEILSDEYRILPDRSIFSTKENDAAEPIAILDYEKESPRERLKFLLKDVRNEIPNTFGDEIEKLVESAIDNILKSFDLVPKVTPARLEYIEPTRPD